MRIRDIIHCLEHIAPKALQESYDNSGLILGNPEQPIGKALICLDVTEEVIQEAARKKCGLIVAHHPLVFSDIKKITTETSTGRCIISALRNDIAIYAFHTNYDAVENGVNAALCAKLGLVNCRILKPAKGMLRKLVTFCPVKYSDKVRNAMFAAGAGHIGNYDSCSYNIDGFGTFRALENTNPFVGSKNQIHREPETRIEVIFPVYAENSILSAMKKAHPYEEVAYDIYPLENAWHKAGSGMIGELKKEIDTIQFLSKLKKLLSIPFIRHSALNTKKIKKVAVCGGSGTFLLQEAIRKHADIFITSDIKYHQFSEPVNSIILADAGHYETERPSLDNIAAFISKKFPTFAVLISEKNTNFVHYI